MIDTLLKFMKLEIRSLCLTLWLDFDYKLLKVASHNPMDNVIESASQSGSENMCRITYLWLENYRDLLWPSFDLEVYLVEGQNSYGTFGM